MKNYDVLIIGAGMVGLTLALAIRKLSPLTVAIVDTQTLSPLTDEPELRVSAINAASTAIFQNLAVWQDILNTRAQAYQHMHVWDKAGFGKLEFSNESLKQAQLGFIIENKVIRNSLWQKAQQENGIDFYTQENIQNLGVDEQTVFASFASQMPITAKLVVGADGANSWLRQQLNTALTFRDYDHHALVATVECSQGHQNTAWQVFLPTGPLAFLPLASNQHQGKLASIVWSTSPEDAERLKQLSTSAFEQEISAAADGKLGVVRLKSEKVTYPLTMRLAQHFVEKRAVLIGDAAHTIHPLAGQGVNLGLKDAVALAESLAEQVAKQAAVGQEFQPESKALNAFERWRKHDAAEMIAAMETIKQTFTPQDKATQLIRGIGMSLLNQITPVKQQMIKQALGYQRHLPKLATISRELSQ